MDAQLNELDVILFCKAAWFWNSTYVALMQCACYVCIRGSLMDLKVFFHKDSYKFVVYHGYLNEKVGLVQLCKLPFSKHRSLAGPKAV